MRHSVFTRAALLTLPFVVAALGVVSALLGKTHFKWLTAEDGTAENLQVLAFAASATLAVSIGFHLRTLGERRLSALYLAAGAGLLFVVGEEVSWGQRLLGLETPEPLEGINRQGEINFHNIPMVELGFRYLQLLVGAAGTLVPLALVRRPDLATRFGLPGWMIPPPELAAYMVFPFAWRAFRFLVAVPPRYRFVVSEYAEVVELIMALGILLTLTVQWRRLKGEAHAVPATATRSSPPLPELLVALDRAGIACCLLRDDATRESGEVDLLVAPEHLGRLGHLLRGYGYRRASPPGHAPHHFFTPPRGGGVTLDVVTDLRFGRPIRALRAGDVRECLQRRMGGSRPGPDDAFVLLLLHCLLDKADFAPRHAARLTALLSVLRTRPTYLTAAREQVERWLAPTLSWERVERAVEEGDWPALLALRARLARQLFWRAPLSSAARVVAGQLARRARTLLPREGAAPPDAPPAEKATTHLPLPAETVPGARGTYHGAHLNGRGER